MLKISQSCSRAKRYDWVPNRWTYRRPNAYTHGYTSTVPEYDFAAHSMHGLSNAGVWNLGDFVEISVILGLHKSSICIPTGEWMHVELGTFRDSLSRSGIWICSWFYAWVVVCINVENFAILLPRKKVWFSTNPLNVSTPKCIHTRIHINSTRVWLRSPFYAWVIEWQGFEI